MPRRARALLALLAALGLGACGGDSPESVSTPQDVVRDVTRDVTAALSDRDAVCEPNRYETRRFVDRATYGVPKYATRVAELCRANVEQFAARSVKVSGVRVNGDRARATVIATGGANAFGKVTFALVRDGVWKVDSVLAVDVDRAKFDAVQRRGARTSDPPATSAQIACTQRVFSRLDDAALERAIRTSDPKLATEPALICFLRPELRRQGLSAGEASCVVRAMRSTDGLVGILLREDEKELEGLFARAIPGCAQSSV